MVSPMELLAPAGGADGMRAALLARLAGDEVEAPAAPALSPLDMLTSALAGDPASADVVEALRRRAARDAARGAEVEPEVDELHDDTDEGVVPPAAAAEVIDVLERLHAEVRELRARSARLAAALGACPRCFGDDDACPTCHGRGAPGARVPHPRLFDEIVRPAVRRAAGAVVARPTTRESA
jgi:hypothetical protein